MSAEEPNAVVPQGNPRLEARIAQLGMTSEKLAEAAGLSVRSIKRYRHGEKPRLGEAKQVADALGCEIHELWPDRFPVLSPPSSGTVAVSLYGSRTRVPAQVWDEHFRSANQAIDILVLAGTFLFDQLHGFAAILEDASQRGVTTRFLTGDPSSPAVALRGHEEGTTVHARCNLTIDLVRPLLALPGFQARTHDTALYSSIFRADDRIIANAHIWGSPGAANPVLIVDYDTDDHLWGVYCRSFDRVWERGKPLTAP
jgi:lambda repressor-like predicted transcriptional regulator